MEKPHSTSDIDECGENMDDCTQICINDAGSYSCLCDHGFYLANDSQSCDDIDECTEEMDGCHHTCTNNIGSYSCSCFDGYNLSDGQTCQG